MLVQELKKLKLQKEMISLRRKCGDEDQTGTIEFVNDEITILCMFSDDGEFDGYAIFYTKQIYEVLWGNRKHKAIVSLSKDYGDKKKLTVSGESFLEIFEK